jgi:leucyl aminopeptidase
LPSNVCTPTYFAKSAQALVAEYASVMKIEVLEEQDAKNLGMGAFLAVAKGSAEPPKFIVLHYKGAKTDEKPIVLIGKGVTFDSGGICLKPAAGMEEMKFDMLGAASVLGTLKAAALLKLSINVIGIMPVVENMPGGRATKPGDIVSTLLGKTIEIINTDAEGRLILADSLAYSERFEPTAVIDIATLTGAIIVALGTVATGLMSNNIGLTQEIELAGKQSSDYVWTLPLWEDYQEQIDSNIADMMNIGVDGGKSITAACLLERFAKKFPWAHLDIAGSGWKSGRFKTASGRPVALLVQFLLNRCI